MSMVAKKNVRVVRPPPLPPSELVDESVLSKLGEVTAVDVLNGFATALSKKRKVVLSAIRVDEELRER